MRLQKVLTLACLLTGSVFGEYGFSSYSFIHPFKQRHPEIRYRKVSRAPLEDSKLGSLSYSDMDVSIFYTQFLNDKNAICGQIGYDLLNLEWDLNPLFHDTHFHYLTGSLGFITMYLQDWHCLANAGFSVSTSGKALDHWRQSFVVHGMLWGRYHLSELCGLHLGVVGWYGVKYGQIRPIVGFDWKLSENWTANTIYPIDISASYHFINSPWILQIAYASFGGPCRYPRVAFKGKTLAQNPTFQIFSKGIELNLINQIKEVSSITIGVGYNFGGWLLSQHHDTYPETYFHFHPAYYVQGYIHSTF